MAQEATEVPQCDAKEIKCTECLNSLKSNSSMEIKFAVPCRILPGISMITASMKEHENIVVTCKSKCTDLH